MAIYFLHLRDHIDEIRDLDGTDYRDFNALKHAVITAARDVMSADIRNGIVDLRYRIDAEDDAGRMVYTLPFSAAVRIIADAS